MKERYFNTSPISTVKENSLYRKNWTFQEYFNFVDEELEEMLIDLFTRYNIRYDGFNLYHYFEPERPWWKGKPPERKLKPLTVEMIIESARAGVWLYE
nr:Protein of uncharacterised function (DUF1493) [Raoultella sp. NCTC 9187]